MNGQIVDSFGQTHETYQDYLKNSTHWQNVRQRMLLKYNNTCQDCRVRLIPSNLQVHHNTYDRVGRELDSDLELLCWVCHGKRHYKSHYTPFEEVEYVTYYKPKKGRFFKTLLWIAVIGVIISVLTSVSFAVALVVVGIIFTLWFIFTL